MITPAVVLSLLLQAPVPAPVSTAAEPDPTSSVGAGSIVASQVPGTATSQRPGTIQESPEPGRTPAIPLSGGAVPADTEDQVPDPPPSLGEPLPTYPLGPGATPDFWAPGSPFQLTDLRFGLVDDLGTTQSFAARLKVGNMGLVGAEFEGERRTLSLLARRTQVRLSTTDGRIDAAASFRSRRFILSADLVENDVLGEKGYVFRPGVALRLSPGFELLGNIETDSRKPGGDTVRASSAGFLWQRGAGFEATGLYQHERIPTEAPNSEGGLAVNTANEASIAAVGQIGRVAELYGSGFLRDTNGRFPRTEMGGTVGTRVAVSRRLRVEGQATSTFEDGGGQQSHDYRGGFTWFARRQTLPRSGEAARRSATLARKATRLGLNERRSDTELGRREQRLRLSLNGRAEDLADDARSVYEAQIAERDVPVFGGEYVDTADGLTGREAGMARVFVGIPWPPSPPWRENPGAVPFLRLDLARERTTTAVDYEALTYRVRAHDLPQPGDGCRRSLVPGGAHGLRYHPRHRAARHLRDLLHLRLRPIARGQQAQDRGPGEGRSPRPLPEATVTARRGSVPPRSHLASNADDEGTQPESTRAAAGCYPALVKGPKTCIALVRGLNVGKARRIPMADLRELVEKLGYGHVRTILASGNIVFTAPSGSASDAARRLEFSLTERFGAPTRVAVVTALDLETILAQNPFGGGTRDPSRLLVAVLACDADASRLSNLARLDWAPEALAVGSLAAYLWCPQGVLDSALVKAVGRLLGESATTRNWATMTKLGAAIATASA